MINRVFEFTHPALPGVSVFALGTETEIGKRQEVLVCIPPNGTIPLHKHSVDAEMYIVHGTATLLSDDSELDGAVVATGTRVFFQKSMNHGFKAGDKGMKFISRNNGIVNADSQKWDIEFAAV
ncbi:MAG: hypothetical protein A2751_02440 [Candidatus Doudnabacteria bacterium RIFCSPHIGHO2_01_FULL_46_14]|uniref:Cupin type-2 domain-containing protein n=1 Tax=Candidatus Doudnabacteria bacterium RIFCSPHIGHO2_01_FULL_46_14 TaxID=1817824 RepID=A0A1F5NKE8_9BACT|nr:MAG: hypothetical protein A2751_02440 [Candidatus Doudnabacteria bacterium RIFCSPHIGHO2_01_FULL_46_14]